MPFQKTGSLPPEVQFFREPDSQAWRPKIPASEQPGGQPTTKFVMAVDVPYFLHTKAPLLPVFMEVENGNLSYWRDAFFHLPWRCIPGFQNISIQISSRNVTWMGSFPHEGCCFWSWMCKTAFQNIYPTSRARFFNYRRSHKKMYISITQRMNQWYI